MAVHSQLRVAFLGSGSSGNAAAVTDGRTTLLVDCGLSARDLARRLGSVGIDPDSVTNILVTHEHTDHVKGIRVFVARTGATVHATAGTRWAAHLDAIAADVRTLPTGSPRIKTDDTDGRATHLGRLILPEDMDNAETGRT